MQSDMEDEKKLRQKSINEILPIELIQRSLLRVPVKHFPRLRCISKLWHSLISDPHFAELHLHHFPAPTNACIYIKDHTLTYFVYFNDALCNDDNDALLVKEVSPPFKEKDDLNHLDCFSLRANSWINLDFALPKPLDFSDYISCGLFLNGVVHWLSDFDGPCGHVILVFDLKEKDFLQDVYI
ncbi:hypothetical protein PIB30_030691 [Stylosanthes scabra]|uniref:F-box domain-containing protein n=1 Tax=Stylosanthes scabra TaxID=79078 RepID=A0ABU6SD75_9FABA|nr:hypothetical protein [Stylosanthes scabra]